MGVTTIGHRSRYATGTALLAGLLVLLVPASAGRAPLAPDAAPPFDTWLAAVIDEAVDRGFDRRLVEGALVGLEPLPRVLAADRAQAGPVTTLDDYLAVRLSPALIAAGQDMRRRHHDVLASVTEAFGVDGRFLVAFWGAESGYGRNMGDVPVFQALATLAWDRRRAPYFRSELFQALRLLADGDVDRATMTGSWAGAMGQPQFMPSSYLRYAVDFDGDGRRDIWRSPADTLASIAHYLQAFGWRPDGTWGLEVTVAADARAAIDRLVTGRTRGCGALRSLSEPRPLGAWAARGLRALDGGPLPRLAVEASLLTLDRHTFLVIANYEAILAYNCSHRYALSVARLADAIG